jgi:hypothetical protein
MDDLLAVLLVLSLQSCHVRALDCKYTDIWTDIPDTRKPQMYHAQVRGDRMHVILPYAHTLTVLNVEPLKPENSDSIAETHNN